MDRLESLGNSLSQITLYDIKSMYNQAKNVVLNVSETEAKVKEATNDEPWGASSTLMQEIAQGTFNFQQFNEIMPCIYGRFMEKEARQWRQIYKALQLLEYLIKHGSERVVDDARSHISTLKMLRNFHYIDEKGKDEGINVRNRAKELVELLSDVEKIRGERRKAKANRSKYIGVGNDGGYGGGFSSFDSGSRYGGFGGDSLGGGGGRGGRGSPSNWSNDYYGSSSRGGGGGGGGGFSDSSSGRRGFEEYNAGDDEISPGGGRTSSSSVHRSGSLGRPTMRKSSTPISATSPTSPTTGKAPAAPVANLLDFDDDDNVTAVPAPAPAVATGLGKNKALPNVGLDDDDFADFQAAPTTTTQMPAVTMTASAAAPQAAPAAAKPNLMQMLSATPMSPAAQTQQHRPTGSLSMQPMLGGTTMRSATTTITMGGGNAPMVPTPMRTNTMSPQTTTSTNTTTTTKTGGGFDDLWNLSLASTGKTVASSGGDPQGKSMRDLQKEKSTAGLWGAGGSGGGRGFGGGIGGSSTSGGGDDLLL